METWEKIDNDNLRVTRNDNSIHAFDVSRAEIETELFHLKADKDKLERDFQNKINILEAKLAILDS